MSTPREPDPISTQLHETEVRLERQLDEVCEMKEVAEESTGQFIKLEEKLLEAAELAKQAFSLRRRRRLVNEAADGTAGSAGSGATRTADGPGAADTGAAPGDEQLAAAPRTVVDDDGLVWHVWAVSAERMRANPLTGDQLGAYRDGWLAFESEDGKQRKRLPNFPPNWSTMSDAEVRVLLVRAESARPSRPRVRRESREPREANGEQEQGA